MSARSAGRGAELWSVVAVAASAGAIGCGIGFLVTSGRLLSGAAARPSAAHVLGAIVVASVLALGRCALRHAGRVAGRDAALRTLARSRVRLYESLAALTPAGLHGRPYGRLLRFAAAAADGAEDRARLGAMPMAAAIAGGTVAVIAEWSLLPPAGLALLGALLIGGAGAPWAVHRVTLRERRRSAAARTELSRLTMETLRGLPELIAHDAAPRRLHGLRRIDRSVTRAEGRSAWIKGAAPGLTMLSTGSAMFCGLLFGVAAVREGRLDGALLAVVVLIPLAAGEAVAVLSAAVRHHLGSCQKTALVRTVLDADADADADAADAAEPLPLPLPRLGGYALRLRGVGTGGAGGEGACLTGVDLDLPPGRRVAVAGQSGAVRSALVAVLLRLAGYEGSVTLNGVELRDLSGADVRRIVGLCARDAHVFASTVAENIRVARPAASDAEVAHVVERAGLGPWTAALPEGLETPLGERGVPVPGEERLRIAMARALLADFPVLIMDEPDPAIPPDPGGEARRATVLAGLLAAAGGRTVLLVTHRPPTPGADAALCGVDEVITPATAPS